jgi:imidazolonepropionase
MWDTLWHNVHLATMTGDGIGAIRDAALAVRDGRIAWLGPAAALPAGTAVHSDRDGGGAWLTPGLVDCHTHIVYAGSRAAEFEARLGGASYAQIAASGGGILSTVRATRAATERELLAQSLPRVRALLAEGVTTLEIKSGYGLDLETEARLLRVARRIARELPVTVRTTYLGAHALPPEYAGRADDYIAEICEYTLPALAEEGLVDAVDAFCETIAFTPAQVARVFDAARRFDLPVKLHAGQLSDQGGAELVARHHGLSADHLEHVSAAGIERMARHGTVAVLLPGAFYFLRETVRPPVAALRAAGVPMAVATDCNPGSSPLTSLLLAMNMACTLFGLSPAEALAGVTRHAARALGLHGECGTLEAGARADFVLWDVAEPAELPYAMGFNPCAGVVFGGVERPAAPALRRPA